MTLTADQAQQILASQAPASSPASGATQPPVDPAQTDTSGNFGAPAPAPAGAPAAPARTGGPSPSIASQMFQQADALPQSSKPGAWARALIGGLGNALGNVGAAVGNVGVAPAGSGFLYGFSKGAQGIDERNRQIAAQQEKIKQQDIENKRLQAQQQISQQTADADTMRAKAAMAEGQINAHHEAKINRNLDYEAAQRAWSDSEKSRNALEEQGSQTLYHNLPSDQLQTMLQNKQLSSVKNYIFQDGFADVTDATTGKPVLDENGDPMQRPTFSVMSEIPTVKVNADRAAYLSRFSGTDIQENQELPGSLYYMLQKRADANRATLLAAADTAAKIQNLNSESKEHNAEAWDKGLSAQEKQTKIQASKVFAPYLSQSDGDVILAFDAMGRSKDKDKLGMVEQLVGPGGIERARKDALSDLGKTISSGTTQLAKTNKLMADRQDDLYVAKPSKPLTPQQTVSNAQVQKDLDNYQAQIDDINRDLKAARQQRNRYMGLNPQEDERIVANVEALKKLPESHRANAILTSSAPDAAKLHLFNVLGLPVPVQLQPKSVQPAAPQTPQQPTAPQVAPAPAPAQ